MAAVLDATLAELATVDYENLSMEAVAERAGVNKTTLYRRWATKSDLTRAALTHIVDRNIATADTGSLRTDILAVVRSFRDVTTSVHSPCVLRLFVSSVAETEVGEIVASVRAKKEVETQAMLARARARGELAADVDARLVFEVIFGAVQHQTLFMRRRCDDSMLEKIVDLVLAGAQHLSANEAAKAHQGELPRPAAPLSNHPRGRAAKSLRSHSTKATGAQPREASTDGKPHEAR